MGIECVVPNLPTPENQSYKIWGSITSTIHFNDDIVVGWSTGAIFSLKYLYENDIKCNKLILISGFNNYIGNVPFVDNINKDFIAPSALSMRCIFVKNKEGIYYER